MRTIYRYTVPVDDRAHGFAMTTQQRPYGAWPAYGGSGTLNDLVEFWAEAHTGEPAAHRYFRVYGTGHEVPQGAEHVATLPRLPSGLVWHLFEVTHAALGAMTVVLVGGTVRPPQQVGAAHDRRRLP